jgi:hypothetical protein
LIGILGTAIVYAIYIRCDDSVELSGFALLYLAGYLDWRAHKGRRESKDDVAWIESSDLDEGLERDIGLTDVQICRPEEFYRAPVLDARNVPIDGRWM